MERVEEVAKFANADEFIRRLPKGYSTYIGPRGLTLSGGQKQRQKFKLTQLSWHTSI